MKQFENIFLIGVTKRRDLSANFNEFTTVGIFSRLIFLIDTCTKLYNSIISMEI